MSQQTVGGGSTLADFSVPSTGGYDGAGNRLAVTASLPGSGGGQTTYAYDARNELTQETSTRGGGYSNAFAYDGAENPTTFRGAAVGAANADNQLPGTGPDGDGSTTTFAGASHSFNAENQDTANTYDGNGNPTTYKGVSLTFDPENRLPAFGSAFTAGYDGDGHRAWKQYANGRYYNFYDGDDWLFKVDATGAMSAVNTFGTNGLVSRYGFAGPGVSTFYTFDPSGNISQRLSSTGTALGHYVMDAFGGRASTESTNDGFSGIGGRWGTVYDQEAGLVLMTHRYYDPATGRFLTRDPIGYDGGVNLYAYVGNDPVNEIDPTGLTENVGHTQGDAKLQYDIDKLNQELNGGGLTPQRRAELKKDINALKEKIVTNEKARKERNKNKRKSNKFEQCPPVRVVIGPPIITHDPVKMPSVPVFRNRAPRPVRPTEGPIFDPDDGPVDIPGFPEGFPVFEVP